MSTIFRIDPTQGGAKLAFALVDSAAVGYLPEWQAPGGKDLTNVTLADYTGALPSGAGADYSCQVNSGALTASPNTTDETVPASFCDPEQTVTNVGVTSYTLDVTGGQDPNVAVGVSRYLFENDTKEAYFYLGLNGVDPPTAIGRVRLIAGAIGGDSGVRLTFTLSLPVSSKPDIAFGDTTASTIVEGDGTIVPGVLTSSASSSSSSARVDVGV